MSPEHQYPHQDQEVEEIIIFLHNASSSEDTNFSLAHKLEAVRGVKPGTERFYRLLSRPFSDDALGLADIAYLVQGVIYPALSEDELTEEQIQEIMSYVGSGTYQRLCEHWRITGKTLDDIAISFKGWSERKRTTMYP